MADERRKGPPDRRRSRATKAPQETATSTPDVQPSEEARAPNPDVARFDAEELDASIRARQHEDRGEVL